MLPQVPSSPDQSPKGQLELAYASVRDQGLSSATRPARRRKPAKRIHDDAEPAEAMLPLHGDQQPVTPIVKSLGFPGPRKTLAASEFDQGTKIEAAYRARNESPVTMEKHVKAKLQAECPQNLEVVMAAITSDMELTSRQRTDFKSALPGLARVTGRDLALIPTEPGALRELFISILPAAHGITPGRWLHIRSRVTRAVQRSGAPIMPGRFSSTFTFAWNICRKRCRTNVQRSA